MFLLIVQWNWGENEGNETILGDGIAGRIGEIAFTIFADVVGVFAYGLN